MWYLIYVLTSAGRDFHIRGLKVGDIRPTNVFINHEGQAKVSTYLTWPS